ncbi:MAG: helix-turn-helix domain-containing protein [Gemmatimonadetes bacterium]|nr:helix-turn-helix domain-containing protein [Gemmatimonadota bacterium]
MAELMDARATGAYLGLHPETVRLWAREGRLPAVRIGNRWRFRRADLDRWLDEKATEKQPVLPGT